ncbi:MAG TPA: hypothetical protein VLX59_01250, partial [Acidimicrobiales bacterium]|nr:hypothetical protein [Acidimicrobiales bacterium]
MTDEMSARPTGEPSSSPEEQADQTRPAEGEPAAATPADGPSDGDGAVTPAEAGTADAGEATETETAPATETETAPAAAGVAAASAAPAAATTSGPDAQSQIFEAGYKPPPGTTTSSRIGRIARSTAAVILIVLGILCMTLSPLTIWGRNLILNTDRYVETLKPIAHNTGVQNAIVTAVDKHVDQNIDVKQLISQSNLPPKAAQALGPALQSALSSLVNTVVTKFVQSKAFVTLWVAINKTAHTQLVYFLTGSRQSGLKVNNKGELVLDLSPVVSTVKKQLVSAGLTVAN